MRLFLLLAACVALSGCGQWPAPPPKEEPPTETTPEPPPPTETTPEPTPEPPPPDGGCAVSPGNGQDAITAAIKACPDGATVRFPANGSYTQTGPIVVANRSGVIDGNGSTFTSTAPNDGDSTPNWRIDSGSNLTLQGMNIVGNFTPGARGIKPGNQLNHGVLIRGGDDITVRDTRIRNVWGDGVTTTRSGWVLGDSLAGTTPRNVRLQRLTVRSAARMCIAFTEQIGGWLEDSDLSDCHYGGVDLEIDVAGQKLQDIHLLRNRIAGHYLFGIAVEGPVPGMGTAAPGDLDRIEVRDNTIGVGDTCWEPIIFSDRDTPRGPISNVTVADNTVSSQGTGISLYDVNGGSVSGNDITLTKSLGWCGTSTWPTVPVRVARSTSVSQSGNTAHGY